MIRRIDYRDRGDYLTAVRVAEILHELDAVCQPREDGELSLERVLPEK